MKDLFIKEKKKKKKGQSQQGHFNYLRSFFFSLFFLLWVEAQIKTDCVVKAFLKMSQISFLTALPSEIQNKLLTNSNDWTFPWNFSQIYSWSQSSSRIIYEQAKSLIVV